jgi:hypothetical protein
LSELPPWYRRSKGPICAYQGPFRDTYHPVLTGEL